MSSLRVGTALLLGAALWVGLSLFIPSHGVASTESICRAWFKKQKYGEAARCFLGLYQQLKGKKQRSEEEREKMGAALRNAGLIMRKAAAREKNPAKAAYLREKAVGYFTSFLQQKLYTSETQRRYSLVQRDALKEKIGYARLRLLAPTSARLQITGYRFSAKSQGPWSRDVRPGTYAIIAKLGGVTETRELLLKPGQPKVLRLFGSTQRRATPPRRLPVLRRGVGPQRPAVVKRRLVPPRRLVVIVKREPPPMKPSHRRKWPWLLVGVGAAAIAAGGILSGVAVMTLGQRDKRIETTLAQPAAQRSFDDTLAIQNLHAEANTQLLIGVVVGGIGAGLLGLGGLFAALPTPKNAAPPTNMSSPE